MDWFTCLMTDERNTMDLFNEARILRVPDKLLNNCHVFREVLRQPLAARLGCLEAERV